MTIRLQRLRELDLAESAQAGRPRHFSAASGLVRAGNWLYVVGDDEHHLGMYGATGSAPGRLLRLFDGALPLAPPARKRAKPDLEALLLLPPCARHRHGALLALGSGSRPGRQRGVLLALAADGSPAAVAPRTIELAPLHARLAAEFGELNLEGAVLSGEHLLLLQRGNRQQRRNAIVRLQLAAVQRALAHGDTLADVGVQDIADYELGAVGDVPLGFTDATPLAGGGLLFSAVAEATDDAYADGPCSAAVLGHIDRHGALRWLRPLAPPAKIEGLQVQPPDDSGELRVLLVSDADDPAVPAGLYEARLPASDLAD